MKVLFTIWLLAGTVMAALGQTKPMEIPLYPDKVPNEVPGIDEEERVVRPNKTVMITKVRKPTLTVFKPAKGKANGTAVIICPGGGYTKLSFSHEGTDVAQKFTEQGYTAFVLKYRLPDASVSPEPEIAPLQDAQQAIMVVRSRAKEWGIDPGRVGIMGFSAGGHLASTAGTHFTRPVINNPSNTSLRPDFLLLIYPVISSDSAISHKGSFERLLGKNAPVQKLKQYANEEQVTAQTPPAFLVHASDDKAVPVQNSIAFYLALQQHKIPAELHVYQGGGHGFGLINKTTKSLWFNSCLHWLESNGLASVPKK